MKNAIFAFSFTFFWVMMASGAPTVPNEVKLPGTQQGEVATYTSPDNCDNCHGGTSNPNFEPNFGWRGSMMANASRDPIFWPTLAVAEEDFVPNSDVSQRGGVGDMCLKCHTVNGWMANRSTPTNGSGLSATADKNGVECEFCHLMVNPDQQINISGTTEVQNSPFLAYELMTGHGYYGAAEYVLNGNGVRLGPYSNATAKHQFLPSAFHRQAEFCGTCHDVSNPAVGDLAPNNGAFAPLPPGKFSGTLGTPVNTKAALNNYPNQFGIVERTFSEWKSSAFQNYLVNNYPTLPSELKKANGALEIAYTRAYSARSNANYEDGALRYFTCQTCHLSASTGVGCNKSGTPVRTDLPRHDMTGSGYWMPDVINYQDTKGTLRFGGGLTQIQKDALSAGKQRATDILKSALSLSAWQESNNLKVKIINLTGHKLISGYPEGRRMWVNVRWYDAGNNLISENGAYGYIGRTVNDANGIPKQVFSILDPENTKVYEVKMGMDQAWAEKLITLGYDPNLVLSYDPITDQPLHTLGELASSPSGTKFHTFHFALNNVVTEDNRIPPYGFSYDLAKQNGVQPVPETQYGNPSTGGYYNYFDEILYQIPSGASYAQIRVYYQPTSWEYVQFLWKGNDELDPFLGMEGRNLLDAWLNTGMASPLEIASFTATNLVSPMLSPPGEPSHQSVKAEHMRAYLNDSTGNIDIFYTPACEATGHTIYYGNISSLQSSNWYSGSICLDDISGQTSFSPPDGDIFFVIVGRNDDYEGSYGKTSEGTERPQAVGIGNCPKNQNLAGTTCDASFKRLNKIGSQN